MPQWDDHMKYLERVVDDDVVHLREKEQTYRGSWKRRGGVGAFMMLARKWDRLESMLSLEDGTQYNIFAAIEANPSGADGTVLAEIRDLRRYLVLVEAEMMAQGVMRSETPSSGDSGGWKHSLSVGEIKSRAERVADGGSQHAVHDLAMMTSAEPWIIAGPPPEKQDNAYEKLTHTAYRLKSVVSWTLQTDDELPYCLVREIEDQTVVNRWWVLDIKCCPSHLRRQFPVLSADHNEYEWRNLPESRQWEKLLYDRNPDGEYRIKREWEAWTRDH